MNSLYVHGISTTSALLHRNDLWEEKKRKVIRLCYNGTNRNFTCSCDLTSHMNQTTEHGPIKSDKIHLPSLNNLSIKELAPLQQTKEETRSRKVVNSNGIGIVPFLRGRVFLIIGATGFLAKGDHLWDEKKRYVTNLPCKGYSTKNVLIRASNLISDSNTYAPILKTPDHHPSSLPNSGREKAVNSDGLGIAKFLTGKVFLITGATGFLAKVLVEKILRTVPDVGKIYLLIKAKDKDTAMERLKKEIVDSELFRCMGKSHDNAYQEFIMNKLVPVVGNVCESNLGMEAELADLIANEVEIIVHSAGNTSFHERYDVAIDINTLGPCRMLSFAKRCKGLKLFMHVSTAYTNGQRKGVISEKSFHNGDSITRELASFENCMNSFPVLHVEAEIKMALDARNAFQDNIVTQKMQHMGLERARLYGWQDTYVFTKAMGEMMIGSQRDEIPVVIIRPSIIESTYKEPIPGWIDGLRMMDPLLIYYGKGELTAFPIDAKGVMDTVPADMVVNAMLAAMAKHGAVRKPGLPVYHIASSVVNPLVYQDLCDYLFEYFKFSPYMDMERRPINVQRMNLFSCMDDFHTHIHTKAVQRSAKSPQGINFKKRLRRSLEFTKQLANLYEPYTFYEGRFDNTNMQMLMKELSQEEKRHFNFDVGSVDWKDYICNIHIPGLLRHVQKGRGL